MTDVAQYSFGNFLLSPVRRELVLDGRALELGATAFDLLAHLLRHAGQSVGREALIAAVWGRRTVEANNLTVQMSALRGVLALQPGGRHFIQTLPGKGYVFTAPVVATLVAAGLATVPSSRFVTGFIGRGAELEAVAALLQAHRLVTVTGVGGIGKTRLVMCLGAALLADYADGVRMVDLAPHAEPLRIADIIATACGAGDSAADAETALVSVLRPARMLLILDNAEHLVGVVGRLLQLILSECPGVMVLVTSRVSLGIAGEQLFRLLPMPVPQETDGISAAEARQYDSVRLFCERAAALLPGFRLEDAGPSVIAEICRRLDGIALAIEMAVPRLQVLTAPRLLALLHQRFHLLAPRAPDALPRQRTLRTMFDWSWELLQPAERRLLQHLAVFAGSGSLASLVAMGEAEQSGEWEVLDALTGVVQASLASAETEPAEPRYRMLETTRHYALESLPAGGVEALRRRHAETIATLFEQAEASWPTAPGAAWLAQYGPDADNLRAALDWAFSPAGDIELGLRLVAASYPLWWDLPGLPLRESRRWFDLAVVRIGPATPLAVQARLWFGHCWRDVQVGDVDNLASAERAIDLYRRLGDPIGLGAALWRAGSAVQIHGKLAASDDFLLECEAVLRRHPVPTKWLGLCLIRRAGVLAHEGRLQDSLPLYQEGIDIARAAGHWYGLMLGGSNMAESMFRLGQHEAAVAQLYAFRDALPAGQRVPLISTLATQLAAVGRSAEALAAVRDVLNAARSTGLVAALSRALEALALITLETGDPETAARINGFALSVHPATRVRTSAREEIFIRVKQGLATALGAAGSDRLQAVGAAWSETEAIDAALLVLVAQTTLEPVRGVA